MDTAVQISIPHKTAVAIAKLLKDNLRVLDREIRRGKEKRAGEMILTVLKEKRKKIRRCYETLKQAGVQTGDTTIVNEW